MSRGNRSDRRKKALTTIRAFVDSRNLDTSYGEVTVLMWKDGISFDDGKGTLRDIRLSKNGHIFMSASYRFKTHTNDNLAFFPEEMTLETLEEIVSKLPHIDAPADSIEYTHEEKN